MMWFHVYQQSASFLLCVYILAQPGQACWGSLTSVSSGDGTFLISPLKKHLNGRRKPKSLFLPVREYWAGGCCLCHQMFFCSFPATTRSEDKSGYTIGEPKIKVEKERLFKKKKKKKTWAATYYRYVVLSKLKKASADILDSVQPSRHHCSLIRLVAPHPRILYNLISQPLPFAPSLTASLPGRFYLAYE